MGLIALAFTGVLVSYSASRQQLINAGENPHYYLERQGFFVVIGLVLMFIISRIDYRRFDIAATPLYVFTLLSLAGVFVIGNTPWARSGGTALRRIQIQPSEFAVLFLILAIATFCARRTEGLTMYDVMRLLVDGRRYRSLSS